MVTVARIGENTLNNAPRVRISKSQAEDFERIRSILDDNKIFEPLKKFLLGIKTHGPEDTHRRSISEFATESIKNRLEYITPHSKVLSAIDLVSEMDKSSADYASLGVLNDALLVADEIDSKTMTRICNIVKANSTDLKTAEKMLEFFDDIFSFVDFQTHPDPILNLFENYADMPNVKVKSLMIAIQNISNSNLMELFTSRISIPEFKEFFTKLDANEEKTAMVLLTIRDICINNAHSPENMDKMIGYLSNFLLLNQDNQKFWPHMHVKNNDFFLAASSSGTKASFDIDVYLIADILYRRSEVSLNELQGIFSSKEAAHSAFDNYLQRIGIKDPKTLSIKQKRMLIIASDDIDFLSINADELNEHIRIRNGESPDFNRRIFDIEKSGFRISHGSLGKMESAEMHNKPREHIIGAIISSVCGYHDIVVPHVNQSYSRREEYAEYLSQKATLFSTVSNITKIISKWPAPNSTGNENLHDLLLQHRYEDALDLFETIANNTDPELGKMVSESIKEFNKKFPSKERKQYIYAYTVENNNNILNITNTYTSACVFLPDGKFNTAALKYAIDPGVVLINFSIGKERYSCNLEHRTVHGVAIGALGISEGRRVLYIDSIEGGIDFHKAVNSQEQNLLMMAIPYAKRIGAEEIFLYALPTNRTAIDFVEMSNWSVKDAPLKLLVNEGHYFESMQATETQSITVRYLDLAELARK